MGTIKLGYKEALLMAAVAASSFNLVPLVLAPIGAFLLLAGIQLATDRGQLRPLEGVSDVRLVLAAYLMVSFAYAATIGVNVFNYDLYRREFKCFLPFAFYIAVASLRFQADLSPMLVRTLIIVSLIALLWLIVSLAFPGLSLRGLYAYNAMGSVWEVTGTGLPVFLGLFLSHSAAGGFYSIAAVYLIAVAPSFEKGRRAGPIIAAVGALACFYFTLSRAFAVGLLIVSAVGLVLDFIAARRTLNRDGMQRWLHLAAAFTAIAILFSVQTAGMFLRPGQIPSISAQRESPDRLMSDESLNADVRLRNVAIRFALWSEAVDDFLSSPLVGVGVTRFDDDLNVLRTMDRWTLENVFGFNADAVENYVPRHFVAPLVDINISPEAFHTDQHAHNVYLHVLAEGGVMLFGLFAAIYWCLVRDLSRSARTDPDTLRRGLARGSIMAIAVLAIASVFGNNLVGVVPLLTILSIAGYLAGSASRPSTRVSRVAPRAS